MTDLRACYFCEKHRTGEDPPPGGWLVEDDDWLVGHGPVNMCLAGSLRIESRRHFTDFAEVPDGEAASFGRLLTGLHRAMRHATGAERIHLVATMDYQPHFYAWLYPRTATDKLRGTAFLNHEMSCDRADAEGVAARIRMALQSGRKRLTSEPAQQKSIVVSSPRGANSKSIDSASAQRPNAPSTRGLSDQASPRFGACCRPVADVARRPPATSILSGGTCRP